MKFKKIALIIISMISIILFTGCGATAKYGESTNGNITGEMLTISDGFEHAVTGILWQIKEMDHKGNPTGNIITKWEQYHKEAFGGQATKVTIAGAFNATGQIVSAGLIRDGLIGKKACGNGANCGTVIDIDNLPTAQSISESINETGVGLGSGILLAE